MTNTQNFKNNAARDLKDPKLQNALLGLRQSFKKHRHVKKDLGQSYQDLRDEATKIKTHTLEHLDFYLERFEENAIASGAQVHWALDAEEAKEIIIEICENVGAKRITKGKSMLTEEIHLNPALEAKGYEVTETDLGEYIIQLRKENPSHILGPALHLTRDEVGETFHEHHVKYGKLDYSNDPVTLQLEAREIIREKFLNADVGITGGNFCIAETGSTMIVTNEGNGDLTQNLPKVHIAVSSIEKMVPTLEDCTTMIRALTRAATAQEISVYNTFSTGPRREGDLGGPEAFHIILLDNGRSEMINSDYHELLRCIRCGACLNNCPVYTNIGGHAYGATYMGPMGAVWTPKLIGLRHSQHLPNASTFCGACEEVCPVKIPLPKLMRQLRVEENDQKLSPASQRCGMTLFTFISMRPKLYRFLMRAFGKLFGGSSKFKSLPLISRWTKTREFPTPSKKTFLDMWKE
ncbi:MAG: LutB/LldF family L-lactate oxidation iron-sulfur protein [Sphingomonadales bacterium]